MAFSRLIMLIFVASCAVVHQRARAGDIEPILTETDAIAGMPLVMPVRVGRTGQPRTSLMLRFPDGQQVRGELAAVRFRPRAGGTDWLPDGPAWDVLTPAQAAKDRDGLAWFVLAELPRGVVGQEVWLDGKPVRLRWLPRPAILGLQFGFDHAEPGGPLEDPWTSPVPDDWRKRPDLRTMLIPAKTDPLRSWRALLATDGLHPEQNESGAGGVAITPDLLDASVLEAAAVQRSIGERLQQTVRAQTLARWRTALARLWAADPALSFRIRHALAGACTFPDGVGGGVTAPVWPANDAQSSALLSMLLDPGVPASERADRASDWLDGVQAAAVWVIDDGVHGVGDGAESYASPATIGAALLSAGDGSVIPMARGSLTRPVGLRSREASRFRAPQPDRADQHGASVSWYRILGSDYGVRFDGSIVDLSPPGLATGPIRAEHTMASLLGGAAVSPAAESPSGLISADGARVGSPPRVRLLVRLPAGDRDTPSPHTTAGEWTVRVWLGPFGRSRAVLLVSSSGSSELQALAGGEAIPLPDVDIGSDDGDLMIDILLPFEAAEESGLVHIGFEVLGPGAERAGDDRLDRARWGWPRAMLPWAIEPARRVVNPSAWLGGLGD